MKLCQPLTFASIFTIIVSVLFAITADPNRNTLDPDMLIQGITPYLMANIHDATNLTNSLTQLYDFFARYVRKLHSDRHIKNTMTSNPGKSFLEMIGPSDVAYVICMLKNSMIRWMQDPTDGTSSAKQLFTRGESKKRQFGKSTMSEEGMKFFQAGVKNWRPAFDQKGPLYGSMKRGWDEWLREDASVVNTDGWRKKSICDLLTTRQEASLPEEPEENSPDKESSFAECESGYDSDGDVGGSEVEPIETGAAGRREGTARETFANDDDSGNEEDEEETETNKKKGGHKDEHDEEEEEDLPSPPRRGKKTKIANMPDDAVNERASKRLRAKK